MTGLTQININSVEDLLGALKFGSSIRQTDSTAINAKSSRSHAIFSLNLVQKKGQGSKLDKRLSVPVEALAGSDATITTDSKLHFVDLAGSERLKNTGAQGERAKEGISINAGLASLGKVISQLSSRHAGTHVSYRDSRLTRLLQDSLGGNAITYMIACVTPAEFHLSETLNTVQYAQRARAIQSKPEIQQTADDTDKAGRIERLQQEVAFLREQIKHERLESKTFTGNDRNNRREVELQNQLMDMQESYNTLSKRHQMLITEISKARDDEAAETPALRDAIGDSALDRLKRSNTLAAAVDSVVLEYETTIQTLENMVSTTRSSYSNSESALMEKESKIAYMGTLIQQLQARLQKAAERESSNDAYLRDLETQMEGVTSNEEKSAALVQSLRKELARVKEQEGSAEDYISTLEERLAEAEQDQEIMQREIDRLERVVERQRSIGRLDNLLAELDSVRHIEKQNGKKQANGHKKVLSDPFHDQNANGTVAEEEMVNGDHLDLDFGNASEHLVNDDSLQFDAVDTLTDGSHQPETTEDAQSKFVADKLETVSQELFDLRVEHEATTNDYDMLQHKYMTALQTLAKLQAKLEEHVVEVDAASTPRGTDTPASTQKESFLGDAGVSPEREDGQPSSSRSLSSELSLLQAATTTTEQETHKKVGTADAISDKFDPSQIPLPSEDGDLFAEEMQALKRLQAETDIQLKELTDGYAQLHQRHQVALSQVEDLKNEVQRAQMMRPSSPTLDRQMMRPSSPLLPVVRRKPSQDFMTLAANSDRTTRSFASLRNIALDNFEDDVDTRQNFETNLNTIMTELHNRVERVHSLEAETATVRRELESKTTLIAGLTRERSTLNAASNVDFSVVGQMREQLMESEHQIRSLHETHAAREQELQAQIENLRSKLEYFPNGSLPTPQTEQTSGMPGDFPETPAPVLDASKELGEDQAVGAALYRQESRTSGEVAELQRELANWENKHNEAMKSMRASETRLLNTITDLEALIKTAEAGKAQQEAEARSKAGEAAAVAAGFEQERAKHRELVDALQREVESYRSSGQEQVEKLKKLEQSYANILQQVEEESKSRELTDKELRTHRDLVANLENQLEVHQSAISIHQQNLTSLQAAHSKEIDELKEALSAAEQDANNRLADLQQQHSDALTEMEEELKKAQYEGSALFAAASLALGKEVDATNLGWRLREFKNEQNNHISDLENRHIRMTNDLKEVQDELQAALTNIVNLESKASELRMINEETLHNLEKVAQKERKSARLVQELEDQLSSNFDQHQAANNRLSVMQNERQLHLEEAEHARGELQKELEDSRLKISVLEVSGKCRSSTVSVLTSPQSQLRELQRRSVASTVRESQTFGPNRDSLSPEAAAIALARSGSASSNPRRSTPPATALPSPPPAIPLPPLPGSPNLGTGAYTNGIDARTASPVLNSRPGSPNPVGPTDPGLSQVIEEQEARIRTIEKHLFAEKQLTATLEEALVDLETSQNKTRSEMDAWRKKCAHLEDELVGLRRERTSSRASLQAVEEEREMRVRAERARMALEERMRELNAGKKKKKGTLNCF